MQYLSVLVRALSSCLSFQLFTPLHHCWASLGLVLYHSKVDMSFKVLVSVSVFLCSQIPGLYFGSHFVPRAKNFYLISSLYEKALDYSYMATHDNPLLPSLSWGLSRAVWCYCLIPALRAFISCLDFLPGFPPMITDMLPGDKWYIMWQPFFLEIIYRLLQLAWYFLFSFSRTFFLSVLHQFLESFCPSTDPGITYPFLWYLSSITFWVQISLAFFLYLAHD